MWVACLAPVFLAVVGCLAYSLGLWGHQRRVAASMLCPYCLEETSFEHKVEGRFQFYVCKKCGVDKPLSVDYVKYSSVRRVVVSAVGFTGHGKTVYLASLFHELDAVARYTQFYSYEMEPSSTKIVRANIESLRQRTLPAPSPVTFPSPPVLLYTLPGLGASFFLFYDVGGEAFTEGPRVLTEKAWFVAYSPAILFVLSLDLMKPPDPEAPFDGLRMHDLLETYAQAYSAMGQDTRNQHLVVILTMADRLEPTLGRRCPDLWQYLKEGTVDQFHNADMRQYIRKMREVSRGLADFVHDNGGGQFVNFARDRFRSVEFSAVSALGAEPEGQQLREAITPKRVLDPLLWVLVKVFPRTVAMRA